MKTKSLGFIGGGRITKIFLQVIKNNKSEYKSIVVFETDNEVISRLKLQFPVIIVASDAGEAAKQDIVFIALHPPAIMETLEIVKEQVRPDAIVISLAPKISLAKMSSKLPHVAHLARLIPNATSIVNEGYNPVTFADSFTDHKKQSILRILRRMGHTFEVPETKLESYAILSAMLPTYFWFQWEELSKLGISMGLSEEESNNAVRDTLLAAIRAFFYSGLPPREVMDLIPVKPMAEYEVVIRKMYHDSLIPLYEKIKP